MTSANPKPTPHPHAQKPRARETNDFARKPMPHGVIFSQLGRGKRLPYFGYIPTKIDPNRPPLVTVHGISRNAAEHAFQFKPLAEKYGVPVIAPLFSMSSYKRYRRLNSKVDKYRADQSLNLTLKAAEDIFDVDFSKIVLFGHSAGGQFVHRYLMAHPDRAERASIFAPGWYSMPTPKISYPVGIGGKTSPIRNLDKFLEIEMQVLVGDRDRNRDASLNRSKRIDKLQGRNRVIRAQTWTAEMKKYANIRGVESRVSLSIIDNAGHSFTENARYFGLCERVMKHVYGSVRTGLGD